ncbi:hypothetical protein C0584_03755 [Candidatus Parcubacteria bacterium]|nr:MAG: hypothetical protein C0584_03755 [Candidatus Parcubacteria bacterium]
MGEKVLKLREGYKLRGDLQFRFLLEDSEVLYKDFKSAMENMVGNERMSVVVSGKLFQENVSGEGEQGLRILIQIFFLTYSRFSECTWGPFQEVMRPILITPKFIELFQSSAEKFYNKVMKDTPNLYRLPFNRFVERLKNEKETYPQISEIEGYLRKIRKRGLETEDMKKILEMVEIARR